MQTPLTKVFISNAQCVVSSITAGINTSQIPTLTALQFISLLKKKGLIDSQLTEQAVNTCFNEVKFKNDLQINYEQFLDLVQFIARVKYPHLSYEASFGVFEHDLTLTIGEKKYAVSAEKKTAIIPKKMVIKLSKHTKKTSPRKMSLNA